MHWLEKNQFPLKSCFHLTWVRCCSCVVDITLLTAVILQQIDVVDYHSFMNYWMIISRKDKRGWWMSRLDEKVVVGVSWSDKLEQDEEETRTSSTPVVSGQSGPATFLSDHAKHSNTYSPDISDVGKCIKLCRQWFKFYLVWRHLAWYCVCRVWYY